MQLAKVIKKIEKRLGKKGCVSFSDTNRNGNAKAWVQHNGTVLSFWTNCNGEDDCHLWHIRSVGDESDPYCDYYAGSYRSNLTQALDSLQPPPSKFKKGDTVKFKPTKRNKRWGRAGLLGIVITDAASATSWNVLLPDGTQQTYCKANDIGLVA